jgi:hypothetical protein
MYLTIYHTTVTSLDLALLEASLLSIPNMESEANPPSDWGADIKPSNGQLERIVPVYTMLEKPHQEPSRERNHTSNSSQQRPGLICLSGNHQNSPQRSAYRLHPPITALEGLLLAETRCKNHLERQTPHSQISPRKSKLVGSFF